MVDLILDDARQSVQASDIHGGDGRRTEELREIRATLRCLIQAVDELNDRFINVVQRNPTLGSW